MLFNSFEFALFFPVVTIIFFMLPHKFRWLLLLLASCFFYMFFKPVYIFILIFTIIIDYYAAIWIDKQDNKSKRKLFLICSLCANIGVLALFKYYNFFAVNINDIIQAAGKGYRLDLLNILLPIGLSFHTFQAMSYTIEVYKRRQKPEKHFGIYALYVMFYPQLVAGPIERPQNILPQFHEKKFFNINNLQSGLRLILWGLFKKTVIADRLAIAVDNVYNLPYNDWSGFSVLIATVFFALQIYCDFSGYSDIAIGTARCMGFNLMANFKQPYFSKSISEFWTRWHISLSTWFKDYLYIPLGGNRVSRHRVYFNLFLVFLISGVWHGANWTFVLWGALHGSFLVGALLFQSLFPNLKLPTIINTCITFLLVCLAWVYFRANNISEANHLFAQIFYFDSNYFLLSKADLHGLPPLYLGLPFWKFCITATIVPCFLLLDFLIYTNKKNSFYRFPTPIRWGVYYGLIICILFFGVFSTNQFIYFQF